MELDIRKTQNEAELTVRGEGYTFLTLLKSALLEDRRTQSVTYRVDMITGQQGVLRLKTKEDPITVLSGAANKIVSQCNDFKKALTKGK
ncbi:MAG: DNA-directed RNA polymerase subunit L [Euryarchaeota archaeon]|nr:DNA-directed RNA polymerase subunit L [Euryarchaeota archaeon]